MSDIVNLAEHQPRRSFVCTGCGTTRESKEALEVHWDERPACRMSLNRPAGQFGARTPGEHCGGCHAADDAPLNRDGSCPTHAYRGCPGC